MSENRPDNHGGNLYQAARVYNVEPAEWLDYSANINPLGPPPGLENLLRAGIDELAYYPDPDCTELKEAIAGYLALAPERIIIGNGASEIIALVFEFWRPRQVLIPAPTFSEYARMAGRQGVQVEYFALPEAIGFHLDPGTLSAAMHESIDMLFLCNPNNPTSTLLGIDTIRFLLAEAKRKNITIVIDEAFIELTAAGNDNSCTDLLEQYDNLFIIRAFTKLFAIPGLRLGYGLGPCAAIKPMWELKLPWSVNSLACRMGSLLAEGKEYLRRTAAWINTESTWFYEQISHIKGLKAFPPATNFMLVKLLEPTCNASTLRHQLANRKILIRDAGNFTFLNERFIRLAIKDRASNLRLLKELQEIIDDRQIK